MEINPNGGKRDVKNTSNYFTPMVIHGMTMRPCISVAGQNVAFSQ
jgi:hypothetical protein